LIFVLVLSSSGVGIYIWSKKKQSKDKKQEKPSPKQAPKPMEKPVVSKVTSEIPKDLITDISIDYVDTGKCEVAYSMHYKGISHQGTFKDGDKDTFVLKSFGRFVVVKPRLMKEGIDASIARKDISGTKAGKLTSATQPATTAIKTANNHYENSFVYLAIYNKKQLVTGLKVNLQTGEQIKGLPTEWEQLED